MAAKIFGPICVGLMLALVLRAQDSTNQSGTIPLTPADLRSLPSLSAEQLAALMSTLDAIPAISPDAVPPGASRFRSTSAVRKFGS